MKGHWLATARWFAGIGLATLAVGVAISPARAFAGLLLAGFALLAMGLFGLVFISIKALVNAGWHTALRRVPEAMVGLIIPGAALIVAALLGARHLYPWADPELMAHDHLLQLKAAWLNLPFFYVRAVIYLLIWIGCARLIIGASRQQDQDGNPEHNHRIARYGAMFLLLFAVTFSAASFDWLMSLEPHWFSTIFALYTFAGLFLSGMAAMTMLVIHLQHHGILRGINSSHLHDLGKLTFAFSSFWAYIWLSQYLLIWYANIPEESAYFVPRVAGAWGSLMVANLVINWALPFLLLMPASSKRNANFLFKMCALLLVGRWLDLYIMIVPALQHGGPAMPVIYDVAAAATVAGVFLVIFARGFAEAAPQPLHDPYLHESLAHHTA